MWLEWLLHPCYWQEVTVVCLMVAVDMVVGLMNILTACTHLDRNIMIIIKFYKYNEIIYIQYQL